MLKGKMPHELKTIEERREDEYQGDINGVQKDFDQFSLIMLHKPIIDYYYKMLYDNNPKSKLFLCDTRLTDFYGIEKTLYFKAESVKMWKNEEDYPATNFSSN